MGSRQQGRVVTPVVSLLSILCRLPGLQGSVSGGPGLCGQELGEARRADTLTSLEPGTGERERERGTRAIVSTATFTSVTRQRPARSTPGEWGGWSENDSDTKKIVARIRKRRDVKNIDGTWKKIGDLRLTSDIGPSDPHEAIRWLNGSYLKQFLHEYFPLKAGYNSNCFWVFASVKWKVFHNSRSICYCQIYIFLH